MPPSPVRSAPESVEIERCPRRPPPGLSDEKLVAATAPVSYAALIIAETVLMSSPSGEGVDALGTSSGSSTSRSRCR